MRGKGIFKKEGAGVRATRFTGLNPKEGVYLVIEFLGAFLFAGSHASFCLHDEKGTHIMPP